MRKVCFKTLYYGFVILLCNLAQAFQHVVLHNVLFMSRSVICDVTRSMLGTLHPAPLRHWKGNLVMCQISGMYRAVKRLADKELVLSRPISFVTYKQIICQLLNWYQLSFISEYGKMCLIQIQVIISGFQDIQNELSNELLLIS